MVIPLYFLPMLSYLPTNISKQHTSQQHSIQGDNNSINPFVARFSDGHATLCRKRVYQINYSSYTHKTVY